MLLARTLGRTVQELGNSITAEEYGLWMEEYRNNPWGEIRSDTGFGIVAATLANVHRSGNRTAYKPTDFMPWHERGDSEAETEDERENILRMMGHGG